VSADGARRQGAPSHRTGMAWTGRPTNGGGRNQGGEFEGGTHWKRGHVLLAVRELA